MPRDIDDVLYFRNDISPFLVHLTRDLPQERNAKEALEQMISDRELVAGTDPVSTAQYGTWTARMNPDEIRRFFGAVCFTETPLNEIHCLLEITNRQVNLAPYGLVFLKDRLRSRGVAPVLYLNNELANKDSVFQALCSLIDSNPDEAAQILPLFSVFGKSVLAPWAIRNQRFDIDFLWEREWRYPSESGPLSFDAEDVFVGICPHQEIEELEAALPEVSFIDPRRNMKWYATKLVEARQRLDIKASVV